MLQWLRRPNQPEGLCDWDAGTCEIAAKRGQLEVLQWLRRPDMAKGQCDWDEWTCIKKYFVPFERTRYEVLSSFLNDRRVRYILVLVHVHIQASGLLSGHRGRQEVEGGGST